MRAVNADDLIHELDKDGIMEYGYVSVFGIPIIEDCVPVVRCKDCRYRNWETNGCDRNPCVKPWWEDDYCSYGEE